MARRTPSRSNASAHGNSRVRADSTRHVRYAVVGLGYISQAAALPAFEHARKNSRVAALVSGDDTKLRKLGRKYRIEHTYSYEQYDDCLRSGEVDAVYIGLPNNMHHAYTIRAAEAGVHVLCEKPMALTEQECQQMIDACAHNNVKLMIAYRLHFEAANMKAVELAQNGTLGEVRLFDSVFTMDVKSKENIRLQDEMGGGTLYDIGIYCINAARYLFRAEPVEVAAFSTSRPDERFDEVDEMTTAIMRFPDNRLASFTTNFGTASVSTYRVVGTKGDLRVEPAYELAMDLTHHLTLKGRTRTRNFPKRDQFAPEFIHFSDCILNDRDPEPDGREGLADVRVIRALYESARNGGQTVRLDEFTRDQRPSMQLEMKSPPVKKPQLVHAASPGEG